MILYADQALSIKNSLTEALSKLLPDSTGSATPLPVQLSGLFSSTSISKGDVVVSEGSLWDRVIYIEKGLLRLFYSSVDGKEFNKSFFAEGMLLWPIAPKARSEPSLFTIAALEPCQLLSADFNRFQSSLQAAGCWEKFALLFAEKLVDNKFIREYEFLVEDAESRLDAASSELGPILHRIPDYHLASYIGITNVMLSRIRKRRRADRPV